MSAKLRSESGLQRTWLSQGIEVLFEKLKNSNLEIDCDDGVSNDFEHIDYDVIVIGSGYGGAVAAAELAGRSATDKEGNRRKIRVCVIERGKEFLPGSFPSKLDEGPTEIRYSNIMNSGVGGNQEGLLDFRAGNDVNVLLANGLGGGSLINAGVMERAKSPIFDSWPVDIKIDNDLDNYYSDMEEKLIGTLGQGESLSITNKISEHQSVFKKPLSKTQSLKMMDRKNFSEPNLAIAMNDAVNSAGVQLNACRLCGDCATGCNFQAKNSLDANLLYQAKSNGAEIYTGGAASKIVKKGANWIVHIMYTDAVLRSRQSQPLKIRCKNIVVAAGSLGSTELLLKSEVDGLMFSSQLGKKFSTNGDMIAAAYGQSKVSNSIANENTSHDDRRIGPTITGMIDQRCLNTTEGVVIQDLAIPAPLNLLFTELVSAANSFRLLNKIDWSPHWVSAMKWFRSSRWLKFIDSAAIDTNAFNKTSIFAAMGDDGAKGVLYLPRKHENDCEGVIRVRWKAIKNHPLFNHQVSLINKLTNKFLFFRRRLKGEIIPNPMWKFLPDRLTRLLMNNQKGPITTVHPLGGCSMGEAATTGVTNHLGKVYNGDQSSSEYHEGLLVLDGAIIPSALCINPALTIAAVAQRGIKLLLKTDERWNYPSYDSRVTFSRKESVKRPEFKEIQSPTKNVKPTEVTITERVNGPALIYDDGGVLRNVMIELTLATNPYRLDSIYGKDEKRFIHVDKLTIDTTKREFSGSLYPMSKLRIYYLEDWNKLRTSGRFAEMSDQYLNSVAQYVAPLEGEIQFLRRARSWIFGRAFQSASAWWKNRGRRDRHQKYNQLGTPSWSIRKRSSKLSITRLRKTFGGFTGLLAMFSRAGEIREMTYFLKTSELNKNLKNNNDFNYFDNSPILGVKKFSYLHRSNPWKQLSELSLKEFPNKSRSLKNSPVLALSTQFLASRKIALIQVTSQENQVQAIKDLFSFGMYMARLVLNVHFLSFRKPERPISRRIDRRPAPIKGVKHPIEHQIPVDKVPDNQIEGLRKGDEVYAYLTEYKNEKSKKPPVLLIHGYSASGATFSHETLPNSLASFLHKEDRPVWVADLRTSPVHRHSIYPWTFEEVANSDIPKIVDYVFEKHGKQKMDVVSHCMGSVMLSMALLNSKKIEHSPFFFKNRINRIVLSQATPTPTLSPQNTFGAFFISSYLKEFIPQVYRFRSESNNALSSQIADRVLYSLPYDVKEFDTVNPWKDKTKSIHYAQTRHRMDLLFGKTFELGNVSEKTLDRLDDFFGPINIETINQVSQFAKKRVLTTSSGQNVFLNKESLLTYWPFATLSIHTKSNGLVDVSTGARSKEIFTEAGVNYETLLIEDEKYGHQDVLIGPEAHIDIFPHIERFLGTVKSTDSQYSLPDSRSNAHGGFTVSRSKQTWTIEPPQLGPLLYKPDSTHNDFVVSFGVNESLAVTPFVILVPVTRSKNHIQIRGKDKAERESILTKSVEVGFDKTRTRTNAKFNRENKELESASWITSHISPPLFDWLSKGGSFMVVLVYEGASNLGRSAIPDQAETEVIAYNPNLVTTDGYDQRQQAIIDELRGGDIDDQSFAIATMDLSIDPTSKGDLVKELSHFFESGLANDSVYRRGVMQIQTDQLKKEEGLCFVFGSCQYGAGPFDKEIAHESYKKLDSYLRQNSKVSFMSLIGDQVYVDPSAGLIDPSITHEKFINPYHRWLSNEHVASVFRKLPAYNILDDHEIGDNWEPLSEQSDDWVKNSDYRNGIKYFLQFQRGVLAENSKQKPFLWYSFVENEIDFFVMDTRTERSFRSAENISNPDTTMISKEQLSALKQWLLETHSTKPNSPKFIMSSCSFLPMEVLKHSSTNSNASRIRADGWEGYPTTLIDLLSFLVDENLSQVIFLCGDLHLNSDSEIIVENKTSSRKVTVRSILSSGLYSPFPFANRQPNEVPELEKVQFSLQSASSKTNYQCTINTKVLEPSNGFALVDVDGKTGKVGFELIN